MKRILLYWLPVVAYCGLLYGLSAQSYAPHPSFPYFDKLAHGALYAVLGFLAARAFSSGRTAWSPRFLLMAAALTAIFYGVFDEWHQSFVPGRMSDWKDTVADGIGGILGGVTFLLAISCRARCKLLPKGP